MKNPWKDNGAYSVMFCDYVSLTCKRKEKVIRGTFAACVYPEEREDAFADFDADSSIRRITFLLTKKGKEGWLYNVSP